MATTDARLDETSRALLKDVDELHALEERKRAAPRSSDEFHVLAQEIEEKARHVFELAEQENVEGELDSPIPAERAEQASGDWSDGR